MVNYPVTLNDFPLFLRAGKIIALHNVQNDVASAENSRKNEFYLKVGLNCNPDNSTMENVTANLTQSCIASGSLMFTENTSWRFNATHEMASIKKIQNFIMFAQQLWDKT